MTSLSFGPDMRSSPGLATLRTEKTYRWDVVTAFQYIDNSELRADFNGAYRCCRSSSWAVELQTARAQSTQDLQVVRAPHGASPQSPDGHIGHREGVCG